MKFNRALLLLASVVSAPCLAEVSLNKLNNCVEISRLQKLLTEDPRKIGSCRGIRGALEQAFMAELGPALANEVCFFDTVQYRILTNLSCVRSRSGLPDYLCFRAVDQSEVDSYKAKHDDKMEEPENRYIEAASACETSNGDSTRSPDEIWPYLLRGATTPAFGWIVALGSGDELVTKSLAQHGFVNAEGRFRSSGIRALEYFNIFTEKNVVKLSEGMERVTLDQWILTIDDAPALDAAYSDAMARAGARAYGDYTTFDVFSRTPGSESQGDKLARLEAWEDLLVSELEVHGFEEFTEVSESQKAALRRQIMASQPPAFRGLPVKIHDKFIILRSEVDPDCAMRGGLMVAVVMAMQPDPLTASDYGGVQVAVVGAEHCGSKNRAKPFVDEVMKSVKYEMRNTLE
jgi:hypothetical protein